MARDKGGSSFTSNLLVKKGAALDPRMVVDTRAELFNKETWPYDGDIIYLYNGLVVSVLDDDGKGNNALYVLIDAEHFEEEISWKKIGDSSLSEDFDPAVFPEDTGVGEFTPLAANDSLELAISKLDQNIAELVRETLDNEEVISAAFVEINDKIETKEILSDDPQRINITLGGNPVFRKVISLEYISPNEEVTWEIPCTVALGTFETIILSMKCILRQNFNEEGTISFEYTDHYLFGENGNILKYYFKHTTGSMVIKFTSKVATCLLGTIEFSCPEDSLIEGGDGSTLTTDDVINGGHAI